MHHWLCTAVGFKILIRVYIKESRGFKFLPDISSTFFLFVYFSSRNMIKSFYTASLLLDVLSVFGELSEEVRRKKTFNNLKQITAADSPEGLESSSGLWARANNLVLVVLVQN